MAIVTIGSLDALPEDEQRAFWRDLLASWADNYQRQLDDDYACDREAARIDQEWCA